MIIFYSGRGDRVGPEQILLQHSHIMLSYHDSRERTDARFKRFAAMRAKKRKKKKK